jgi:TolA-binding protein
MKFKTLLLAVLFTFVSVAWAQTQSQAPTSPGGPGSRSQMRAEHRQKMMEMHKQQMEAMKADVEKMKASLAQMKTNVQGITDAKEKARWQANVDMWETMVGHMDGMLKHTESMGLGMMGPGMGGPPSPPQTEKPPQ